ncbi:DUF6879 family protein [Catellatospora methionotrophica]|nr:DUF6879 family protein [Catellatospora methionotrophica]
MSEVLAGEDFESLWRYYRVSAFRLETQPVYTVAGEQDTLRRYLTGHPQHPADVPYLATWLDQIRQVTAEGRRVERVRIVDEPPTDYQRWERWVGQWNTEAGERIRYLSRAVAESIGLPLAADWWLFDEERVAVMRFDETGRPLGGTVVTDPAVVVQHLAWRDLAIKHSALDEGTAH